MTMLDERPTPEPEPGPEVDRLVDAVAARLMERGPKEGKAPWWQSPVAVGLVTLVGTVLATLFNFVSSSLEQERLETAHRLDLKHQVTVDLASVVKGAWDIPSLESRRLYLRFVADSDAVSTEQRDALRETAETLKEQEDAQRELVRHLTEQIEQGEQEVAELQALVASLRERAAASEGAAPRPVRDGAGRGGAAEEPAALPEVARAEAALRRQESLR